MKTRPNFPLGDREKKRCARRSFLDPLGLLVTQDNNTLAYSIISFVVDFDTKYAHS